VDHAATSLNESSVDGSGSISAAVSQQEFNKRLELRLKELKGREKRKKQVTHPAKDLSVSG